MRRRLWAARRDQVEAAALLTATTTLRRTVPMHRWQRLAGTPGPPDRDLGVMQSYAPRHPLAGPDLAVARAVRAAGARLPMHLTCLDRAVAARLMLRRRGAAPRLVIGLDPTGTLSTGEPPVLRSARRRQPAADSTEWGSHAWLVGETGIVVGGPEAVGFHPATVLR